jgi:hypothetical protein
MLLTLDYSETQWQKWVDNGQSMLIIEISTLLVRFISNRKNKMVDGLYGEHHLYRSLGFYLIVRHKRLNRRNVSNLNYFTD